QAPGSPPRPPLAVPTGPANPAAVPSGPWGAVTAPAAQAGCSRQAAYEHAQRVVHAVAEAQAGGPSRAQLQADAQRLADENDQLWRALDEAVFFGSPQQQRFAATAAALGLSLTQTPALLACPPAGCGRPRRARLARRAARGPPPCRGRPGGARCRLPNGSPHPVPGRDLLSSPDHPGRRRAAQPGLGAGATSPRPQWRQLA